MLNKLKKVIIFDAFPKVEAGYQNSSSQGGLVTIIVSILLWILIISEFIEYRSVNHKYEFLVDSSIDHKIQLNVDITINTPCQFLLINVVDVAGEMLHMTNELEVTPTVFEVGSAHHIGEENPSKIDIKRLMRDALKQGDLFSDNKFLGNDLNACRIFGNLEVNKVAGKLHISDIVSMGGLSATNTKDSLNFSHRIDEFSFGTHYPLLVNPLDNSIEISQESMENRFLDILTKF
ncbi:13920_t:CDS:2 [Entrophospora sp. SA101]|nr:13920_t:CDS:2 [Entrophospora sp. SA101]CAJ0825491.1 14283_t:CDS:2 [Entrophospora sp. SA101]